MSQEVTDTQPSGVSGKRKSSPKKDNMAGIKKQLKGLSASVAEHAEVLAALKDVPLLISSLINPRSEVIDPEPIGLELPETNGDPIDSLLQKTQNRVSDDQSTSADEGLLEILNMTQPVSELGSPINADVSLAITRLYQQKQPKEKLERLRSENKPPENCKLLSVSRVNPEIWTILPQRGRQVDYNHQIQQQQVATASSILAKVADKLFTADASSFQSSRDDMLKSILESLTVLGSLSQDMNLKRKLEIKPFLNKDVSAICSASCSTELLFGDNLSEQLKNAKATTNIMRTSQVRGQFRSNRMTPYKTPTTFSPSLNWRSPSQSYRGGLRGRASRGRRQNYQSNLRQFNQQ